MKKYRFEISVVLLLITLTVIGLSLGSKDVEIKEFRKAMYFNKLSDDKVQCTLCPFNCVLSPGQTGLCKARKNVDGEMISLTYGKPVSLAIDPIEKKPFFHFYPGTQAFSLGTAGCNLHCDFCQNWQISQVSPEKVPNYEISSENIVKKAIESGSKSIAFTYNEPIVFYEMMLETAKLAKQKSLRTVMVTNGYINTEPLEELAEYIDAANVDLKAFTEKFYSKHTGATLEPVLRSLKTLKKKGVFIEVTNLIVPGENDTEKEITELCEWIKTNLGKETPLHFSRFFPAYKLQNVPPTPVETLKMAKKIAEKVGLKNVYIGNVITEGGENTICPKCGKVVIERERYNVKKNRLENGKCPKCGKEITGMFEKKRIREEVVAGMWYPDNATELTNMLEELDKKCDAQKVENTSGLIVPHAGFIYSGHTAACGFKAVSGNNYEVAVILGTSHRYREGIVSVYDGSFAKTPIGNLKINRELTEKLIKSDEKIKFVEKIHTQEHSLEAELPFIRHYLGDVEVVLVLASTENDETLLKTGKVISDWIKQSGKKTLVVASSDMSHYHSYEDAVKMDRKTISLIEEGKLETLETSIGSKKCELCGWDSLKIFNKIMKDQNALKPELIHYENSGDAVPESREKGVVGYMAMTFSKEEEKSNYYDDNLRNELLKSARESIDYSLKNEKKQFKPKKPTDKKLNEERAVFVTLKLNGELRGCIGQMFATEPLYQAVTEMAHSAAFKDPRFNPLTQDELKKVHIEISVLTPMQKVKDWKEIKNGIDGVWLKKGYRQGVFLPQVATETGWDLETFLSNLCTHKAGLPADCYKDPETEIFKYQVELFEE